MKKTRQGFTLVEIMIVVGIVALLAAIAIPSLLRAKIAANESSAQTTLKSISNALESYSITNGKYPPQMTSLLGVAPPYLTKDYFSGPYNGYIFTPTTLTDYNYTITAAPFASTQGNKSFSVTTGGVLTVN